MATTAASSSKMEMNPRGIPRAPFVADVAEYIAGKNGDVEGVVKTFQETSAKYRYMELSLQQRRKALTTKIPDIDQTLNVVKYLQLRRRKAAGEETITETEADDDEDDDLDDLEEPTEEGALKTLFELNDTLYAEAEIEETGEVGIWLGANTMLLYPLDEANELLSTKLAAAKKSLEETVEDLEWLREQVTVMDVNFARVHNWDVKRRRELKAAAPKGMLESGKKDSEGSDDEND